MTESDTLAKEDRPVAWVREIACGRIETHMYGPGSPFNAWNSSAVSSVNTGPFTCSVAIQS